MTDIAHEPVEAAPRRRRFSWTADNPLVRAVGRVRLPLGAKLLIGFGVVGALLVIGYVLGLQALGQSNSRGEQLRRLQQRAVYYQLVLTDASQLKTAIDYRLKSRTSPRRFGSGLDQTIINEFNQLCVDTGIGNCLGSSFNQVCVNEGVGACVGSSQSAAPPPTLTQLLPFPMFNAVHDGVGQFAFIAGVSPVSTYRPGYKGNPVRLILRDSDGFAATFKSDMAKLARGTRARANDLVAANRQSYSHSRTLLLGVAGGSLALALALALILSWSVVAPLRRAQERLSGIAGGDFSEHVAVPNRDEIGALAADVNRMNDELRRLYGELETASRHKSDFLATMSHELRTPLNAIIGFSEVLQEQMFGELNERQLAYVDDVLEAGKHLLSLINDVLDLAKIEAGKMELELAEVDLPGLLRSAVSMHAERASRGGIELGLRTEPDKITITADERRVRQIVFNLLSNAVKFTPPQGRIDVSARLDDGQVEVAVADTGPGIAAADLDTIFEEFEQAGDDKQAEGTGLGLPPLPQAGRAARRPHLGREQARPRQHLPLHAPRRPRGGGVMDVVHEPVDTAPEPRSRWFGWAADNPLVRTVGRVRLPLGAKLLIGFGVVGALLAIGYVLGVVALGQSNSRGETLRRLQAQAVYEQLLLTDATQLKKAIDFRIASAASTKHFGSGLDQTIGNEIDQLCVDAGIGHCVGSGNPTSQPLSLGSIDPALVVTLGRNYPQFYPIIGDVPPVPGLSVVSVLNHADKMELELSQVEVPELLRSAVSMHGERASRGGIELELLTEPDEITITADERRVRQVVFNLLSNAVKFTPPQGKIDVSARLDDGRVEVAVADTGPGIAPEDLEMIFEEFEQAGDGKQAEGTGLGLPLSRRLVELHGGRLWAESEPGRGSTFRFTLPVRQESEA